MLGKLEDERTAGSDPRIRFSSGDPISLEVNPEINPSTKNVGSSPSKKDMLEYP
jgi:hypothetical protein